MDLDHRLLKVSSVLRMQFYFKGKFNGVDLLGTSRVRWVIRLGQGGKVVSGNGGSQGSEGPGKILSDTGNEFLLTCGYVYRSSLTFTT